MWCLHYCSNCGSSVAQGARFCGRCGSNLSMLVGNTRPVPVSHVPIDGKWKQQQVQKIAGNRDGVAAEKGLLVETPSKPIRTEIIKLISGLFDDQVKRN
jgi:hypothetical protein